jgi:hypothetical protein
MSNRSYVHQQIDKVLDRYLDHTPTSHRRVIMCITNSASFYQRFKAGDAMSTDNAERIMRWLSDNWPAKAVWPEDVPRPDITEA